MDHNLINIVQEQFATFPQIELVGSPVNTPTPAGAVLRETCLIRSPLVKGFNFMDVFFTPVVDDVIAININFFTVHSDGKLDIVHSHAIRATYTHVMEDMHTFLEYIIRDFATARNEVRNDKTA